MFKQSDISAHVEDAFKPVPVPNVHVIDLYDAADMLTSEDVRMLLGLDRGAWHDTFNEEL